MTKDVITIVRKATALVGAALIGWFVCEQGIAAIAARTNSTALLSRFDPAKYPDAGTRLAQIDLAKGRFDQAAALARAATLANPLNVRAVRTLGLALDVSDKTASTHIMRTAEKLSRRDTQTSMWVLRDAALNQDVPRALDQIDALARRQVQSKLTSKIFYAGLTDDPSRRAFAKLLARRPPWRSGFFANIRVNLPVNSYEQMELFLNQLDRTNAPASAEERMTFIDRMVDSGDVRRARAYWFRSFNISSENQAQTPYDPQFRVVAARRADAPISPFDWAINQDMNQYISLRSTDEGPALDIAPGSGDGTALISQTLMLAPGSHRIDTVVEGPADQAPAGWQLVCSQSNSALIRSFARPGDELSGVTIDVPANGCSTQRLILTANGRIGARPISIRQVVIR
ncbi:hypothetical protein [Sphingomonas sp. Leaf339]|uniref:hypothetical protein n=1 Tax=Sphingomonas sp. Leaf339 TaxID=1736343 RepID=UPI0012E3838A|nr:hypothetical protein [Sphingomonas sp. Leaf339]